MENTFKKTSSASFFKMSNQFSEEVMDYVAQLNEQEKDFPDIHTPLARVKRLNEIWFFVFDEIIFYSVEEYARSIIKLSRLLTSPTVSPQVKRLVKPMFEKICQAQEMSLASRRLFVELTIKDPNYFELKEVTHHFLTYFTEAEKNFYENVLCNLEELDRTQSVESSPRV